MSTFTVRVKLRPFPKGPEKLQAEENYTNWRDADTAFCAYQTLCKLIPSIIENVELIENRQEVHHKEATKTDPVVIEIAHDGGAVCFARARRA